jgi:hypothetical protein
MRTEYPAKVLLAWGEAIAGNQPLRDWLIRNGFPELGVFTFALRNKDDARKWLMEKGHAHLLAVIIGVEGDAGALEWLRKNNMNVLRHVAMSGDGDEAAFKWLLDHGHRELAVVSKRIMVVKQEIDDDNRDPHKYSRD